MSLERALAAIGDGHVVGIPTDTVYGLAIDPFNDHAVRRLFDLKGRPVGKPIGLLAASMPQAETIGEFDSEARSLAEEFWPGGLTLILRPKVILSDWVGDSQRQTVGVRIPDHPVALDLLERSGPLAVTSANRSGEPEVFDDVMARSIFSDEVAVYVEGTCPGGVASTVVDATSPELVVLRAGAISFD